MTTCCPNTWAGVEGHPLGDAGTAAFKLSPAGLKWHLVICSELPDLSYSLVYPSSKPWPPYPEPVEPKRKNVLVDTPKYMEHKADSDGQDSLPSLCPVTSLVAVAPQSG